MDVDKARCLKEPERENARLKRLVGEQALDIAILREASRGNWMGPAVRRRAVKRVCVTLKVSERRACHVLGQSRTTQRYEPKVADDEAALTARIVELASQYGRYGHRRVTALLRAEG